MLKWLVYHEDFNRRRIEEVNLFDFYCFHKDCVAAINKYKNNKAAFLNEVQKSLHYYFWSKCEAEIVLTSWPPDHTGSFNEMKISIYDQVFQHWDAFSEWLWARRRELLTTNKADTEVESR